MNQQLIWIEPETMGFQHDHISDDIAHLARLLRDYQAGKIDEHTFNAYSANDTMLATYNRCMIEAQRVIDTAPYPQQGWTMNITNYRPADLRGSV